MRKVLLIAARDYKAAVRTKSFIIGGSGQIGIGVAARLPVQRYDSVAQHAFHRFVRIGGLRRDDGRGQRGRDR